MFSNMRIKECNGQIERNLQQLENLKNINDVNYREIQRSKLINQNNELEIEIKHHKQNPLAVDPKSKLSQAKFKESKIIHCNKKDNYSGNDPAVVSEKTLINHYKKFIAISNSLPEYIVQNTKKNPNNYGYIWKDIYYYGAKKATSNVTYLIEPKKGFEYLHEIHPDRYILKMKKDRNITIIHSIARN